MQNSECFVTGSIVVGMGCELWVKDEGGGESFLTIHPHPTTQGYIVTRQ